MTDKNIKEIIFENRNVIQTIESKGEIIRGKRAKLKHWLYDYEMNDVDLSFLEEFINKENVNLNDDGIIFLSSSRFNDEVK